MKYEKINGLNIPKWQGAWSESLPTWVKDCVNKDWYVPPDPIYQEKSAYPISYCYPAKAKSQTKTTVFDMVKPKSVTPAFPSYSSYTEPLNSADLFMGVEFEGMVKEEIYDDFFNAIVLLGDYSLIQIGEDMSIKDIPEGYVSLEIRTKVLPSGKAIRLFEEILSFLYICSQTEDFITNYSCGLHINISEKKVFDNGKQLDFYAHILQNFDEMNLLQVFQRLNNKYCLPFFKDGDNKDIASIKHKFALCKRRERAAAARGEERAAKESKYFVVALRNSPVHEDFEGEDKKNERIEFRGIGNKDYHLRFDDLNASINHMLEVVQLAYKTVNP